MDKLTAIRIKYDDGTYSEEIPISALAEYIVWNSSYNLVDILGEVDLTKGNIQQQLDEKFDIDDISTYVDTQISTDVTAWLNEHVNPVGSAVVVDDSLTTAGAAADAKETGDQISELSGRIEILENGGAVSTSVREALCTLLSNAAYLTTELNDELLIIQAWASIITKITLNQTGGSIVSNGTIQLAATTTPSGGAVIWSSSDTSVASVSSNGLVTGQGNGTTTITASCGGLSATCSISVSGFAELVSIEAVYTQSSEVYDTDTLDSLSEDLVVTAYYDDSTSRIISSYTLSGTLSFGTTTIVVAFGGKTTTFNVTVDYGVPSDYTRYDYVKNVTTNSNNPAVFTGLNYVYGSNNYEHYLEFAYDSGTSTTSSGLFGLRNTSGTSDNSMTIWHWYTDATTATYSFNFKGTNAGSYTTTIGAKNTMLCTYEGSTIKLYFNNVSILDTTAGAFTVGETGEFSLFKAQTGTSKTNGSGTIKNYDRIYKYTVKDLTTGNYVAYMIPCENSSGEAGFYDAVRHTFYTAYSGASNLTALND